MINSTADDVGPAYFQNPNGTDVLYFTSNRPGRGGFDIYASEVGTDGSFGMPLLVGELSSASNEARTAIRADGLEVVFHSNRLPSTGLADLWVSTRPTVLDPWGTPASLGPVVNSTSNDRQPAFSDDAEVLLFASSRLGQGSLGSDDIWMSERDCTLASERRGDRRGRRRDRRRVRPDATRHGPADDRRHRAHRRRDRPQRRARQLHRRRRPTTSTRIPRPVCTPSAGSLFAIGDTALACTATDASGNTASASFTVTVLGAKPQLLRLIANVVNATTLPAAAKAQLTASLQSLVAGFDPSKPLQRAAACLTLRVFTTVVRFLAPAHASGWTADANRIRAVLAC